MYSLAMGQEKALHEKVSWTVIYIWNTSMVSLGHLVLRLPERQNWERPLLPSLVIPR